MKKYKLLSLDIWDTVLRRKCHPDESKYFIARYLYLKYFSYINSEYRNFYKLADARVECEVELANHAKSNGYDEEYTIYSVFEKLLDKVMMSNADIIKEEKQIIIKKLMDLELEHEKYITYLDKNISSRLKKISYDKCIYISDFYTDSSFIDEILKKNNCEIKFDGKFVSCEYSLNKKSGSLFHKVHDFYNIDPSQHIHLGDNKMCDVMIPKSIGIEAELYRPFGESRNKNRINRVFSERRLTTMIYKNIKNKLTKSTCKDDKSTYHQKKLNTIGKRYGILFYMFVLSIIEEAIKNEIDRIYYFTREGEFFKKIHDEIKASNPLGMKIPEAEILEVSRMATFSASLSEISIREMKRLWSQYSTQSMKSFFKSLNVKTDYYNEFFNRYNIDSDEMIENISENEKVRNLFADEEFRKQLFDEVKAKRELLKQYFFSKGITNDSKKIFIVDVGWRGTIQDNIANIYENAKVYGFYFGLFEPFNKQPSNTVKKAFISKDSNSDKLWCLKYVDPFEMLCNSPNGSTIEYAHHDGKIIAIRENQEIEDSIYNNHVMYFQQGVLSSIRAISDYVRTHSLISDDMNKEASEQLENLMTNPPKALVRAYFELSHNESFGLGGYFKKNGKLNFQLAVRSIFSRKAREEYLSYIRNTHWPQGFFNYHSLYYLTKRYNDHIRRSYSDSLSFASIKASKKMNIDLPEIEEHKIRYFFDQISVDEDIITIRGWGIILGQASSENELYLVMNSDSTTVIFSTEIEIRKDITGHFNDGYNYDYSGYIAKISKSDLYKSKFKLGILIKKAEECSLLYTDSYIQL